MKPFIDEDLDLEETAGLARAGYDAGEELVRNSMRHDPKPTFGDRAKRIGTKMLAAIGIFLEDPETRERRLEAELLREAKRRAVDRGKDTWADITPYSDRFNTPAQRRLAKFGIEHPERRRERELGQAVALVNHTVSELETTEGSANRGRLLAAQRAAERNMSRVLEKPRRGRGIER